jgi:prefoldin subunit 5
MNSFPYGSDSVDPLEAAVEDIEAKKKEWSEALTKLQLTIKEMLKNPEKINLMRM